MIKANPSTLTCPNCGFQKEEDMPTDSCVFFYECTEWGNGVYGATLIGLSVMIFFAGRHAFAKKDVGLMKALLFGTFAWLVTEALFSIYYGVYFNVAVDVGLMLFFVVPLIKAIRSLTNEE